MDMSFPEWWKMIQGRLSVSYFLIVCIGYVVEGCPEGFQFAHEGGPCYKVFNERKNWADAREVCRQEFADLVTVDDKNSVEAMTKLTSSVKKHYWIGLTDMIVEDNFYWLDGTKLVNPKWDPNPDWDQPNGGSDQNCVVGEPSSEYWQDKECTDLYGFVCQFQLGIEAESIDTHVSTRITDKAIQQQQHVLARRRALCVEDCVRYCVHTPACDIFTFQDSLKEESQENCLLGFYGPATSPVASGPGVLTYKCPIRHIHRTGAST